MNTRNLLALGLGVVAVSAFAADANAATTFSTITKNMSTSIASFPTLLAGLCYLFGILLAALGVMKIKDHVENPGNAPLKDGAIRLAAGGGLISLPVITQAMVGTVGSDAAVGQASLTAVTP